MIEISLKTFALIALAYALTTLVFSQKKRCDTHGSAVAGRIVGLSGSV